MGQNTFIQTGTNQVLKDREFKFFKDTKLSDNTKITYQTYLKSLFKCSGVKDEKELLKLSDEQLQNLFEEFLDYQKRRVQDDEISPNTVPKYFKAFKVLLDINYREHAVKWKPLALLYPKQEKRSGFRPYTTQEIAQITKTTEGFRGNHALLRNFAAVHCHASSGARVGIHNDPLLMKHIVKMDGSDLPEGIAYPYDYHCYAILIYAEADETIEEKEQRMVGETDDEDYSKFIFLTPEASKALDAYHDYRKKIGEVFTLDTPIFGIIKEFQGKTDTIHPRQMSGNAFRHAMEYMIDKAKIVRKKKRNRFSLMIDHGFRKRYNTILKRNKQVNPNIAEALMQHIRGLDGAYLKPTRHECFEEFFKAIPDLTIDPNMVLKNKVTRQNQIIEEKDDIIEKKVKKLEDENARLSEQIRKQTSQKTPDDLRDQITRILEEKGLS